mgnify:CR=1 FL=1
MRNTVYPSGNVEHPEVTIASRDIVVYAQGQPILQSPHFEAYAGEVTGIVGPSGCGKTTLLNVLGLLMPPHEGEVVIGGRHMERARVLRSGLMKLPSFFRITELLRNGALSRIFCLIVRPLVVLVLRMRAASF